LFNGQPVTVVGITPSPFAGQIMSAEAWFPYTLEPYLKLGPDLLKTPDTPLLTVEGRLRPGFSRTNSASELSVLAREQDQLHPSRTSAVTLTNGSMLEEPELHSPVSLVVGLTIGVLVFVEKQNSLTIDQQIRKCREYADRHGLVVLDQHIYADEAICGDTDNRAGLQRLLAEAQRKPKPFDVILVDDTSRLSRKLADSMRIFEQLQFARIRVVFVAQGIDTDSEQAEILIATHGIVDSLYLKDLAKRTFRGVEQRALDGFHTGGRVFGYRRVPIESKTERDSHGRPNIEAVKLEVDSDQAATVRRIFERYAAGHSMKRIAVDMNDEGILSPQPQKGRVARSWCPSSVRHILRNERYRGVVVWGRHRKIRSPKTGKKIYEWRPSSEWRRTEIPEQRIISEELWRAVCERIALVNELYSLDARKPGILRARAVGSPYVFSGLLKCSLCGASITVVSGRWAGRQDVRYGCSLHYNRGRGACSNSLLIMRRLLEDQLLAVLREKVLHPDVITYTMKRFEEELLRAVGERDGASVGLRKLEADLERKTANLARSLADGYFASVRAELAQLETQLAGVREKLLGSRQEVVRMRIRDTRRFVESRLAELRTLFNSDPITIRTEIAKHVQKITLTPEGKSYIAAGTWNVLGLGSMDGAGGPARTL
jgi:DNA invertase Pin-like site-specific DNA recombinase